MERRLLPPPVVLVDDLALDPTAARVRRDRFTFAPREPEPSARPARLRPQAA